MRVLVMGAGAVGGYFGAALAAAGHEVTFVARGGHLDALREQVAASIDDPRLVAIGEIGLDFFVPGLDAAHQTWLYTEQLKIARDFDLPVLLHVRKSQDQVYAQLRRVGVRQGIAHAFNGSNEQARRYVEHGMKLGFGGNVTFSRARQIRRLAVEVILDSYSDVTGVPTPFTQLKSAAGDSVTPITMYPPGTRALQVPDALLASDFLDSFGRAERLQTCSCEKTTDASVGQALHLNNGQTLNAKLREK